MFAMKIPSSIVSLSDATTLVSWLVDNLGSQWIPGTDFSTYTDDDGVPRFSSSESELLNKLEFDLRQYINNSPLLNLSQSLPTEKLAEYYATIIESYDGVLAWQLAELTPGDPSFRPELHQKVYELCPWRFGTGGIPIRKT